MPAVVTGASGHVGANLVRALLAAGRHVTCVVHEDERALDGLKVRTVQADLTDARAAARAIAGATVVFHAAGRISIGQGRDPELERINVLATRHVVEACIVLGVKRLVHFSSIHAVSPEPRRETIDERRALVAGPGTRDYDRTKAEGEREVLRGASRGLGTVILRPTAIVGPHDFKPSRMGEVLLALRDGSMPALVAGGFDWVDARDVAAAAMAAERSGKPGEAYLLSGNWRSMRDLAQAVADATGTRAPRFVCPMALARLAAPFAVLAARLARRRPLFSPESLATLRDHSAVSHEKAARDLGFVPRPFEETIRDTCAWFAARGNGTA